MLPYILVGMFVAFEALENYAVHLAGLHWRSIQFAQSVIYRLWL